MAEKGCGSVLWSPLIGHCAVQKDTLNEWTWVRVWCGLAGRVAFCGLSCHFKLMGELITTVGHLEDEGCAELMCLLYSLFASAYCFLVSVCFFISWLQKKKKNKEQRSLTSSLFPYFHASDHIVSCNSFWHLSLFFNPNWKPSFVTSWSYLKKLESSIDFSLCCIAKAVLFGPQ